MAVAVTEERVATTLELLKRRATQGLPCPTNDEVAKAVGMGKQRFQPWDRMTGWRHKSHEAGSVMIRELEKRGHIRVNRGRNWRVIELAATGQILGKRAPAHPK